MLEAMNNLTLGNLDKIETSKAFPLMRWLSGDINNLYAMDRANKLFFKVKPKMILSYLYFNKKSRGYIKYPKKTQFNDEVLELLREYLKTLYSWSDRDITKNKFIIDLLLTKEEYIRYIHNMVGLDKNVAKKFGIDTATKKYEVTKRVDLFSFGG